MHTRPTLEMDGLEERAMTARAGGDEKENLMLASVARDGGKEREHDTLLLMESK